MKYKDGIYNECENLTDTHDKEYEIILVICLTITINQADPCKTKITLGRFISLLLLTIYLTLIVSMSRDMSLFSLILVRTEYQHSNIGRST